MDSQIFLRNQSLNNIPDKKITEKLLQIAKNCNICSNRDLKNQDLSDGLCNKCSIYYIAYNRYAEANIPVEYWDLKMEKDFYGYPLLLDKYKEIVSDLNFAYVNGISICFAGFHGCGKTLTVTNILKKAAQKGYNCLYSNLSDIVNVLIYDDNKFASRRELIMVDFLAIDEFDSRFIPTDNAAELYARTLESIFRTRSQNKLPTFMCTNSPNIIETFKGPLKDSIDSLMNGYVKIFPVLGEDFRSKNKGSK